MIDDQEDSDWDSSFVEQISIGHDYSYDEEFSE